jgi:hypothetical protein
MLPLLGVTCREPKYKAGITVTPYPLQQHLECRTIPPWHAFAASSQWDSRIT